VDIMLKRLTESVTKGAVGTPLMKTNLVKLIVASINEFNNDNGAHLAASISFNFIFSLFPMVFIVLYIAGHVPQWPNLQNQILRGIEYLLPMSREFIGDVISKVTAAEGTIGVLALIGLVWGTISFFNSVRGSLNTVCGVGNPHPMLKAQLFNVCMMLGSGILLFLSVGISNLLRTINQTDVHILGIEFLRHSLATQVLANIIVTGLAFVVFLLLYKLIPSRRPKWKDIWIAALAAAIVFEITKVIFMLYIGIFNPYNLVYGSIGTLIAFLMWIYLSALIFLFMAKITHINLRIRVRSHRADEDL
jgi:membrane protein